MKCFNCELDGWPQLNDLCREHYEEAYLKPAIKRQILADNNVMKCREAIYIVEVAQGLRPRLLSLPIPSKFDHQQERTQHVARPKSSRVVIEYNDEELG